MIQKYNYQNQKILPVLSHARFSPIVFVLFLLTIGGIVTRTAGTTQQKDTFAIG